MKSPDFLKHLFLIAIAGLLAACGSTESESTEIAAEPAEAPKEVESAEEIEAASASASLENADLKISYVIGYNTVEQYVSDRVLAFDKDAFLQGVRDALDEKNSLVSDQDMMAASQEMRQRHAQQQAEEQKELEAEGAKFLAENGAKPGIVTTESGLQYEVLTRGDSEERPSATDMVTVHYHGTLIDGTVFDSSVQRGATSSFPLNGVIPGWTEGLQLMAIGDKFRFFVPYNLAYGPSGRSGIPPYATLIFEVELFKIGEDEESE